jgi:predicted RNase H-like HicB family nuclease
MFIPVAIHQDEGSVFGVTVPDVPGCHSWGDTIEQALANTQEAIYSHVETLIELGEAADIRVSNIDDLRKNESYAGAIWAGVDIDETRVDSKPERVNVSLPRFVLKRIDDFTKEHHETRSGFLARAALRALEHA